jgi:hypothetical protein
MDSQQRAALIKLIDFQLHDVPAIAAITTLRMKAEEIAFPGVPLEISPSGRETARQKRISLQLPEGSVADACRDIASQAGLDLHVEGSDGPLVFTDAAADRAATAGLGEVTAMTVIQPKNRAAFEDLVRRIKAANVGTTFSAADWKKIDAKLGRTWPGWYQELTKTFPLGRVAFRISLEHQPDEESDFMILGPESLLELCEHDYFFTDGFFPDWLQFGEIISWGDPSRWLIPADPSAEPIVHTFSDGDTCPRSLNLRFDDFLLQATFDEALTRGE